MSTHEEIVKVGRPDCDWRRHGKQNTCFSSNLRDGLSIQIARLLVATKLKLAATAELGKIAPSVSGEYTFNCFTSRFINGRLTSSDVLQCPTTSCLRMERNRCPFTAKLPLELRRLIYEFVLQGEPAARLVAKTNNTLYDN